MSRARDNGNNYSGDITGITAGTGLTGGGTSGNVTLTNQLATTIDAAGDLLYGTAADTASRLAIGTAGQVLAVNSGATAPEWATFSSGGMTLIATATPSAATTLAFTSIPTTYKSLIIVWTDVRQSISSGYWGIRLNNDTTTANYFWAARGIWANSPYISTTAQYQDSSLFGNSQSSAPISSHDATVGLESLRGIGSFEIFGADLTSSAKIVRWQSQGNNGNSLGVFGNGRYSGSSAITQIDFIRNSTQTITGTFRLYGIS